MKAESSVLRTILRTYGAPPAPSAGGRGGAASAPLLMKLLLTGTPVQNDIMELFWLCNFVMPAVFSNSQDFARIYRYVRLRLKHDDVAR